MTRAWVHRAIGLLAFAFFCAWPVCAQSPADGLIGERAQRSNDLGEVTNQITLSEETLRRLDGEIALIKRDREELSRQAVVAARAVQQAEGDISASEVRLAGLAKQERAARDVLASKHDIISELLAALQRLSRNPPPALIVAPESALQTVRSAIILGAVLPELRAEAEIVLTELERLRQIRGQIGEEIKVRQTQLASLSENRARLDLLTEEKKRQLATSEQNWQLSRKRVEELAREAQTLRELLSKIDQAVQKADADKRAAELARGQGEGNSSKETSEAERNKRLAGLTPPRSLNNALAFEQAKGQILLPASGQILRRYGEDDGIGSPSRGIVLRTRAGATVSSPADGRIVYAGAFRSYGQIVIVDVGGGHHVLLAGMERITVDPGQFVLAGEALAQMGQTVLATAAALDLESSRPVLYIEFRKDGVTVDPAPWWAQTAEKARG